MGEAQAPGRGEGWARVGDLKSKGGLSHSLVSSWLCAGVQGPSGPAFDVKMTKLGFLRLSYEKQDTLLKLLILSMAAVLCKSVPPGMAPGAGENS